MIFDLFLIAIITKCFCKIYVLCVVSVFRCLVADWMQGVDFYLKYCIFFWFVLGSSREQGSQINVHVSLLIIFFFCSFHRAAVEIFFPSYIIIIILVRDTRLCGRMNTYWDFLNFSVFSINFNIFYFLSWRGPKDCTFIENTYNSQVVSIV